MEITVTLDHGFLDAEFTAENREELEENLLGFVKFLQKNEDEFEEMEFLGKSVVADGQPSLGTESPEVESRSGDTKSVTEQETETTSQEDHPLEPIARQTGVTIEKLDEIVYADPEGEETPQLLIEKSKLGGNKAERQRHASYVLLLVSEDCYGQERMKTSELKTILSMGNISDNNLYNMWKGAGKGMFDPTGKGASATIALTGPGKRKALKFIKELAENEE